MTSGKSQSASDGQEQNDTNFRHEEIPDWLITLVIALDLAGVTFVVQAYSSWDEIIYRECTGFDSIKFGHPPVWLPINPTGMFFAFLVILSISGAILLILLPELVRLPYTSLMPGEKVLFSAHAHPTILSSSGNSLLAAIVIFYFFIMYTWIMPPIFTTVTNSDDFSGGGRGRWCTEYTPGVLDDIALWGSGFLFLFSIWHIAPALTTLLVTNQRVIVKRGFFRRKTFEILLPNVESITIEQDVVGKWWNCGTLTIAGMDNAKIIFDKIAGPIVVKGKIKQVIENNQAQVNSQSPE